MNNTNLNFNTTVETLTLGPDRVLTWNPADPVLVKRLYDLEHILRTDQDAMKLYEISSKKNPSTDDVRKSLEMYDSVAKKIENEINSIFGHNAVEKIFQGASPLSLNEDGALFVTFIKLISPIIKERTEKGVDAALSYQNAVNKNKKVPKK